MEDGGWRGWRGLCFAILYLPSSILVCSRISPRQERQVPHDGLADLELEAGPPVAIHRLGVVALMRVITELGFVAAGLFGGGDGVEVGVVVGDFHLVGADEVFDE